MTRSHPPTLLTLARALVREHELVLPGETVLVAVSGGPDSMALLHVLTRLAPALRARVVAHGVDHGLRSHAAAELRLADAFAQSLGVPFAVSRVNVPQGGNIQARARAARYAALRAAAASTGARLIATGHHADDRAETVLLRLLRGSGPRGLGCLPPQAGDLIRPLLRARRTDISAHLTRHGIDVATDPSNRDPRFLRTRVRYELLPLLAALSPGIVGHLNGLADDLLDAEQAYPPELRRAHREAFRRARARGHGPLALRIAGGREVRATAQGGRFVVEGK